MIKLKRITALTLAMLVLISFYMTHATATPSYREFDDPDHVVDFFDGDAENDSFARVFCTDYGWNEEVYTDFEAETYAYNILYHYGVEMVYVVRARVYLELYYQDEGWSFDTENVIHIPSTYPVGDSAIIYGNDLIDPEHGIGDFITEHQMNVCQQNVGQFWEDEEYVAVSNLGSIIRIGRIDDTTS